MKLHWSPRSPFVRKVMVLAHEAGLAGRLERVRSVVAMRQPNAVLMQDNPLSKLPTLVLDDGRALFDSYVICEYLDSLHGGAPLVPRAGPDRWEALRWHALGNGLLDLQVLWRSERDRPPGGRSSELLEAFAVKGAATLALLEREAAVFGAAAFRIGQIAIACALGYLDFRFADLAWRRAHPRLAAWYGSAALRPSMRDTMPVDD